MRGRVPTVRLACGAAIVLLASLLLSSHDSQRGQAVLSMPTIQAAVAPTETVVIPGMPSCCCVPPEAGAAGVVAASPTPEVGAQSQVAPGAGGRVVAIDPGHGGKETGAVAASGLREKDVNLRIGLRLASLLRQGGYRAVLTRSTDQAVNTAGKDLNGDGKIDNDDDLQARVDIANAAGADIIVSIHNDGSPDESRRGSKTYYCDARPFATENVRLAASLQRHLVAAIRGAGYDTPDIGTSDDAPLKKPYGHLFVVGPLTPRVARASSMPGALGETLYLSNPNEAALLASDSVIAAIAKGYYDGIEAYFAGK